MDQNFHVALISYCKRVEEHKRALQVDRKEQIRKLIMQRLPFEKDEFTIELQYPDTNRVYYYDRDDTSGIIPPSIPVEILLIHSTEEGEIPGRIVDKYLVHPTGGY